LFSRAARLYHERMRIVCPSCGAAYEVPESRLGAGKPVRCSRCGETWAPVEPPPPAPPEPERPRLEERLAPETSAILAPEPAPVVAPVAERSTPPPSGREGERGGPGLKVAWALSFAVLAAAAWGAYDRREDVMRAWPASERAYAALGIADRR